MTVPDQHPERRLTAEEFADGAADGLGDIEIVSGLVIQLMAQSPLHSRVVRRPAEALEAARRRDGPCMVVDSDVAARFADTASSAADRRLNIRYPDVWVRDCEPYDVNTVREHIRCTMGLPCCTTINISTRLPTPIPIFVISGWWSAVLSRDVAMYPADPRTASEQYGGIHIADVSRLLTG